MNVLFRYAVVTAFAVAASTGAVQAAPITVTGYSVFGVNEHISYTGRINSEYVGAGQITLLTTAGSLSSWCTDLFDELAPGTFTQQLLATDQDATGAVLTPNQLAQIGGLVNAGNAMTLTAQGSAAIQNAIWAVEYGSKFSFVSDDGSVAGLTQTYLGDIANGTFALAGAVTQFIAAGNQGQATKATAVPEPASLALLATGLFGLGWLRRRNRRPA